jgi:prepilin-type N-terminal cleavage/methylation domain-containing protein
MHRNPSHPHRAFTLVELAIVLAVIGILVGAVLAGSSLLRQSEMQTIVSDYTKYSTAVAQFTRQYGGQPGDLLDATNYWGDDNTNCPDAAVTNGTPGTCNGNGNGQIITATGAVGANMNEPFRAWQHLQLANYIDGSYTGITAGVIGGSDLVAAFGVNAPKSRITNAGWTMFHYSAVDVANKYSLDIGNLLMFGATNNNKLTRNPAITPSEAWQVDKKIDDALPAFGRVVTLKPVFLANCATSAVDATAEYKLTDNSKACSLMMAIPTK